MDVTSSVLPWQDLGPALVGIAQQHLSEVEMGEEAAAEQDDPQPAAAQDADPLESVEAVVRFTAWASLDP